MNDNVKTWHYGTVARYWAEQMTEGPEIAYYQRLIERYGQPAFDAGCGAGRLLLPFLRAGLDVDGCDASGDMLAFCRKQAEKEGFKPRLYEQALHELDLERAYKTIVACGVFGIGVSREQDRLGLERISRHLEPGGVLLLDRHLPYRNPERWQLWNKEARKQAQLPEPWPDTIGKPAPDYEADYDLETRLVALDPFEQRVTLQMRTIRWPDGKCIVEDEYTLTENIYLRQELQLVLENAGFEIEAIQGDYTEADATAEHDVIVFIARKEPRPGP